MITTLKPGVRTVGLMIAVFAATAQTTMPRAAVYAQSSAPANQGPVTFTKDVATIMQRS